MRKAGFGQLFLFWAVAAPAKLALLHWPVPAVPSCAGPVPLGHANQAEYNPATLNQLLIYPYPASIPYPQQHALI